jgi:hypothetical protein
MGRVLIGAGAGMFLFTAFAWGQMNVCDLAAPFGTIDIADVQAAIDMTLGTIPCPATINVAGIGVCNVVVIQRVINAALGGPCVARTRHSVTLAWAASTSANVVGYFVYRATISGGPYTKLNASSVPGLTYQDNNVLAGQTFFYVVTAVDNNNNESAYSTEAKATVPTP